MFLAGFILKWSEFPFGFKLCQKRKQRKKIILKKTANRFGGLKIRITFAYTSTKREPLETWTLIKKVKNEKHGRFENKDCKSEKCVIMIITEGWNRKKAIHGYKYIGILITSNI